MFMICSYGGMPNIEFIRGEIERMRVQVERQRKGTPIIGTVILFQLKSGVARRHSGCWRRNRGRKVVRFGKVQLVDPLFLSRGNFHRLPPF